MKDSDEIIIAVDPGSDKCGLAVVARSSGVKSQKVIAAGELCDEVIALAEKYRINKIIIGDGTKAREAVNKLAAILVNGKCLEIEPVDEKYSSQEARALYFKLNPPRGLKKLLPVTMLTPPEAIDDYAAIILAERYFKKKFKKINEKSRIF